MVETLIDHGSELNALDNRGCATVLAPLLVPLVLSLLAPLLVPLVLALLASLQQHKLSMYIHESRLVVESLDPLNPKFRSEIRSTDSKVPF